jgi:transmembrane sensor
MAARQLIVEDRPLGEVLAALGRYRHGVVYCATSAICGRSVTGVFATSNPLQALREIETSLGLHAIYLTRYLIFLHDLPGWLPSPLAGDGAARMRGR